MPNHIVLLYTLSDSIGFNTKFSVNEQAFAIQFVVNYFNFVDSNPAFVLVLFFHFLFLRESHAAEIFDHYFVFLIDVYNVDIALIVRCVQLLRAFVPKHAGIDCFIWVLQRNLLSSFCCFEPFESLIIRNCEYQILLWH